jgi:MtN3 and saliva related transmembrane protein
MRADWIGYAAATCTTAAFIPQAIKALREGDTHSLSLGMYVIFTLGVALWGWYGYARGDWAIVIANLITGMLSVAILVTKIRNDVLRVRSHR